MSSRAAHPPLIRVGTAGWSLPKRWQDRFPDGDSHLHRYARVLSAVEINRTFKKTPRASTFARWAASVPSRFRFSLKAPRGITHERRLAHVGPALDDFLEPVAELGEQLGPLLFQLPPSLEFDPALAEGFLGELRGRREGPDVVEARHESWFTAEADELLAAHGVARVAADPPQAPADGAPGGARVTAYFRLHGRPRTYYSAYRDGGLEKWVERVREAAAVGETESVWCIFDNTAVGEGTGDALALREMLGATG